MTEMSLHEFVETKGRAEAADLIGVSYSAVGQMLASDRDIRVRRLSGGTYKAFETKEIKSIDRTGRRKNSAA